MGYWDTAMSLMRGTMDIVNPAHAMTRTAGAIGKGMATGDFGGVEQQLKDDLGAGLLLGGVAATVASGGAAAPAVAGAAGTATTAGGTAAATTAGRVGLSQVAGQLGKGVAKKVATSYARDAARDLLSSGNGHTNSPSTQNYVGAVQPQGPSFQDVAHGAGGIVGSAINAAQPQTSGWGANDGS